jgi:hypothetical protein
MAWPGLSLQNGCGRLQPEAIDSLNVSRGWWLTCHESAGAQMVDVGVNLVSNPADSAGFAGLYGS